MKKDIKCCKIRTIKSLVQRENKNVQVANLNILIKLGEQEANMIKHFVQYQYYALQSECNGLVEEEISERTHEEAMKKAPKNTFGYRFFDAGIKNHTGIILQSDWKNVSPWYFDGTKKTIEEIEKEYACNDTYDLIINLIKNNGGRDIVVNKFGQIIPLDENDEVITF